MLAPLAPVIATTTRLRRTAVPVEPLTPPTSAALRTVASPSCHHAATSIASTVLLALLTDDPSKARWSGPGEKPSVSCVTDDVDVIDTHAHIVPLSLLTELSDTGVSGFSASRTDEGWVVSVPGMGDTRPIRPRMIEPGPRRRYLSETGITRQILSPWMDIQSGRFAAAGEARSWTRRLNDAMCAAAVELGTVALASVDLADGEQAAADLAELHARPEIAGVILNTNPQNAPELHDKLLDPLWTVAEQQRIPVVLHPPTCGPSGALSTIGSMGNVHGRLVDNSIAVSQLILHGLLDRHPGLRVVLVHGGGFLPYQAARLDGGYRTKEAFAGELERGRPSAYLPDFYYDTVGMSEQAIAFLVGLTGAERVLLGSDYPFALGDPQPVRTVRSAGLDEAAVPAILRDNSVALFGRNA
jgi:aminocarboxymuconate-semialdehyde decarboxylase